MKIKLIHIKHLEKCQAQNKHSGNLAIILKYCKGLRKYSQKETSTPNCSVCSHSTSRSSARNEETCVQIKNPPITPVQSLAPGTAAASGMFWGIWPCYVTDILKLFPMLQNGHNIYLSDSLGYLEAHMRRNAWRFWRFCKAPSTVCYKDVVLGEYV